MITRRSALAIAGALLVSACGRAVPDPQVAPVNLYPNETPELRALINKYAAVHDIPESLLHRVIQRESRYNPGARNGPYYGLMQIHPQTARGVGFSGSPNALLDAETNLIYAGKYLKGAWIVSGGDEEEAVMWYSRGYYYEAKRLGLLEETGMRT